MTALEFLPVRLRFAYDVRELLAQTWSSMHSPASCRRKSTGNGFDCKRPHDSGILVNEPANEGAARDRSPNRAAAGESGRSVACRPPAISPVPSSNGHTSAGWL